MYFLKGVVIDFMQEMFYKTLTVTSAKGLGEDRVSLIKNGNAHDQR